MKPKVMLWAVIGVLVVGALVFMLSRPAGGGIEDVDAAGVRAAVESGAKVIDVRTAGEFQMGHIPGAVNAPLDQLGSVAPSWDANATYVVYCATGERSISAVETLKSLGFANIKHFAAGIVAWDGQLEQGEATQSQSVDTAGKPVMMEFFTDS